MTWSEPLEVRDRWSPRTALGRGRSEARRLRFLSAIRPATVAALAASLCASAWMVGIAAAEPDPPVPLVQQEPQPAPSPPNQPAPINPGAKPDPASALDERNRARQAPRDADRTGRAFVPGAPPQAVPGAELPPPQPVQANELGGLQNKTGTILLNFPGETIELLAFVDYVSKALSVNIFSDEGLATHRVLFRAPIEIPVAELLPLLQALLEDKGFVLVRDPLGWYQIKQSANIPAMLDDGAMATTRIIRTPMVKPSSLQGPINATIGGAAAPGGTGGLLRMTAFDELGILIVTGSQRVLNTVERMVDSLLIEFGEQKLHRFALKHVASNHARERLILLNARFGGAGSAGAPVVGAPVGAAGGGAAIATGTLSNLEARLLLDHGNALIFKGTDKEAVQVAEMVRLIDMVTALKVESYQAGPVAQQVADWGERLGLGSATQAAASGTGGSGGRGGFASPIGLGAGRAGASQEQEPSGSGFSVDAENGVLIYFGTTEQHQKVGELVEMFKAQRIGSKVEIKAYKLHNTKAEDVQGLLEDLINAGQNQRLGTSPLIPRSAQSLASRGGTRTIGATRSPTLDQALPAEPGATGAETPDAATGEGGEGGVALAATEGEVTIVADPAHNQLLIKAPTRLHVEFERIIRVLDQRQSQVYIEAQVVAVTTDESFTWTVEMQVNAGQFLIFSSFGLTSPGTATGGDQASQAPRIVPAGNRGLTSAVIKSQYVPIVINTLATDANARVVSHPRILVNDNETGSISSQREEPFASTTQNASTTTTSQGGVATAGTVLNVTPRISAGGYITLEYTIELSDFTAQGQNGLQPPKQTENYESMVTIPTDSTIVVGGFTLLTRREGESRIPVLGKIPILGWLFKSTNRSGRRTTIFVFITPTIMDSQNFGDLRLMTEGPMKTLGVASVTPPLEPEVIPITPADALPSRRIPSNRSPSLE